MIDITWLIIGILAVWRVTYMLNAEDGPGDMFVRLRRFVGEGFLGNLLDCFSCLSLWVSAPVAALMSTDWKQGVFLWLAMSGGATLLQKFVGDESRIKSALFYEEKEADYGLLRKTEEADQE